VLETDHEHSVILARHLAEQGVPCDVLLQHPHTTKGSPTPIDHLGKIVMLEGKDARGEAMK